MPLEFTIIHDDRLDSGSFRMEEYLAVLKQESGSSVLNKADFHGKLTGKRFYGINRLQKKNDYLYISFFAAFNVLLSRDTIVIGPTPPGTGVI